MTIQLDLGLFNIYLDWTEYLSGGFIVNISTSYLANAGVGSGGFGWGD